MASSRIILVLFLLVCVLSATFAFPASSELLAVQTNEADGIKELPEIEHKAELIRDKRSFNNPSQCNLPLLALAPTGVYIDHSIFFGVPNIILNRSVSDRMRDETVRFGFVMPFYGSSRVSHFERVVRDDEGNIVGVRVFRDNKTGKFSGVWNTFLIS